MHLFIDAASIEAFADDGANVLTDTFFPSREFDTIGIYSTGSPVRLTEGVIYPLDRIWDQVGAELRRP